MRNGKAAKVPLLKDLKSNRDLYLMMLPFFLFFFLMILLPVLVATVLSFTYYNMFEMPSFIGLKNYVIQVVGYNMQGDPVSVYPVIALNMVGIGDGSNPGENQPGGNTPGGDGGHTTPGDSDIPSTGERVIVPLIFLLAAVSGAVVVARMRKMQRSAC